MLNPRFETIRAALKKMCASQGSDITDEEIDWIIDLARRVVQAEARLREAEKDAERLNYLETLSMRMYCGPSGKVFPLSTNIHLVNHQACGAYIYVRDEYGRNAQMASGSTLRAAVDATLAAQGEQKEKL